MIDVPNYNKIFSDISAEFTDADDVGHVAAYILCLMMSGVIITHFLHFNHCQSLLMFITLSITIIPFQFP